MSQHDRSNTWSRLITSSLLLTMCMSVPLTALYLTAGGIEVQKAAVRLAMPLGVLWLLLSLALLQLRGRRFSPLSLVIGTAWLIVTFCGNGRVAGMLVSHLESDYSSVQPLQEEPFDYVVVLGGGSSLAINGANQLTGAGERIALAARMYHAGRVRTIVCTGDRIASLRQDLPDPTDLSEQALRELGVPAEHLEKVGGINTAEEMAHLASRFETMDRVGLITSAWHMRRALRLADAQGLAVSPLPGGFISQKSGRSTAAGTVLSLFPDSEALHTSSLAARELLARLVRR